MSQEPTVTIAIPMYNEEKYISSTIESAINQSYKNIKIIISDNCSTDKSFDIASDYADKYKNIELVRQKQTIGIIENFKYPLSITNSKYFMWLGAHDIISKGYIEDAVNVLESTQTNVLVYPGGVTIDENGNLLNEIIDDYDTTGLNLEQRLLRIAKNFNNGYVIHGVLKTEVVKKIPFENVFGTDFLAVLLIAALGNIKRMPAIGFQRRLIRSETQFEQRERHANAGMLKKTQINPFSLLAANLFKHIIKIKEISITDRFFLIFKLKQILKSRFDVTWKDILKSKLNNK